MSPRLQFFNNCSEINGEVIEEIGESKIRFSTDSENTTIDEESENTSEEKNLRSTSSDRIKRFKRSDGKKRKSSEIWKQKRSKKDKSTNEEIRVSCPKEVEEVINCKDTDAPIASTHFQMSLYAWLGPKFLGNAQVLTGQRSKPVTHANTQNLVHTHALACIKRAIKHVIHAIGG